MGENETDQPGVNRVSIQGHGNVIGSGNRVSVVVGEAEASLRERGWEEIATRLRALEEAVARERDWLPDAEEVEEAVAQVATELDGTRRPSRLTLRGALEQIALAASSATGVVAAAQALAQAVQGLA